MMSIVLTESRSPAWHANLFCHQTCRVCADLDHTETEVIKVCVSPRKSCWHTSLWRARSTRALWQSSNTCGLIQQQNLRSVGQCPCDCDSLSSHTQNRRGGGGVRVGQNLLVSRQECSMTLQQMISKADAPRVTTGAGDQHTVCRDGNTKDLLLAA